MFIHHFVSLALLGFSWACNLYRIGTLVMVIHDFADIPLEFAKMMAYCKKQKAADITFSVFALCWILSRICFLPYRIIYHSTFIALQIVPMFSAYYIFNALLIALQSLHIIWTYFIVKMAIRSWRSTDGVSFFFFFFFYSFLRFLSVIISYLISAFSILHETAQGHSLCR